VLKTALIQEQCGLCCYCERSLTRENCQREDVHIEHFRPQSDPTVDPLDYTNLFCSCQSELKRREPRHCGNLKGDWFDNHLLISPLDANCEQKFQYTFDGHVQTTLNTDNPNYQPKQDPAHMTIEKLGLNISQLVEMRKAVINGLFFSEPALTDSEIDILIQDHLQPDSSGNLRPFWATIQYLAQEWK
jgi:uncharacterized protein (TIGR02646 family)